MQAEELTEETLAPLTKEEIVTKFLELQKTANESEQDAVLACQLAQALSKENSELKNLVGSNNSTIEKLNKEKDELFSKVKELNKSLLDSERMRMELFHEFEDLRKDIETYRREVLHDQQENKKMKQLIETQKGALEEAEKRETDLLAQLKRVSRKNEKLSSQAEKAESKELDAAFLEEENRKLRGIETKYKKLEEELNAMKIENQELRDLLTDKEQLSQAVELLMEQNKAYRQQQEEMKKLLDEAKRDAEDLRDQLEHSTLHQSNNHLFDELQDDENTLIIDGASPSSFTGKPTFGGRENRPPNIKETSIPLEEGNEEFKIPSQTFVNNPQQTESSSSKLKTELGVERRAKGKSLSNIPLEEAIPDNGFKDLASSPKKERRKSLLIMKDQHLSSETQEGNNSKEEPQTFNQTFVNNPQQTQSPSFTLKTGSGNEGKGKGKSLPNINEISIPLETEEDNKDLHFQAQSQTIINNQQTQTFNQNFINNPQQTQSPFFTLKTGSGNEGKGKGKSLTNINEISIPSETEEGNENQGKFNNSSQNLNQTQSSSSTLQVGFQVEETQASKPKEDGSTQERNQSPSQTSPPLPIKPRSYSVSSGALSPYRLDTKESQMEENIIKQTVEQFKGRSNTFHQRSPPASRKENEDKLHSLNDKLNKVESGIASLQEKNDESSKREKLLEELNRRLLTAEEKLRGKDSTINHLKGLLSISHKKEGWLQKQGSWWPYIFRKRWICLSAVDNNLYYARIPQERFLGVILLEDAYLQPEINNSFVIHTKLGRKYILHAETEEESYEWIALIQESINTLKHKSNSNKPQHYEADSNYRD